MASICHEQCGGPEVIKFDQITSDGYQMALASKGVPSPGQLGGLYSKIQ